MIVLLLMLFSMNHFGNGQLIYGNSAVYKFIVGFSVPVEIEASGRSLGWFINLQGLYREPNNISYFQPYKIVQKRSLHSDLNRISVYKSLELFFERFNLDGRGCVLRLMCDFAAVGSAADDDPTFANILRIIFTPIMHDGATDDHFEAYSFGANAPTECSSHYNCTYPQILDKLIYD